MDEQKQVKTYTEQELRVSLGNWLWINNIKGSDGNIPNVEGFLIYLDKKRRNPVPEIEGDPQDGLICDSCQ